MVEENKQEFHITAQPTDIKPATAQVSKTEDSFGIAKIMQSIQNHTTEAILQMDPDKMKETADNKLKNIRQFRRDVQSSLEPILADLETLKAQFEGKVYQINEEEQENTDERVLTRDLAEYIECLTLDAHKLDNML